MPAWTVTCLLKLHQEKKRLLEELNPLFVVDRSMLDWQLLLTWEINNVKNYTCPGSGSFTVHLLVDFCIFFSVVPHLQHFWLCLWLVFQTWKCFHLWLEFWQVSRWMSALPLGRNWMWQLMTCHLPKKSPVWQEMILNNDLCSSKTV